MKEETLRKKYMNRSLPWLKKKAQEVFNAWIRERDSEGGYFRCISCDKTKDISQLEAGHYYDRGECDGLRYHENNVHGQCTYCNNFKSSHLVKPLYRENLIKKIGLEAVEELDFLAASYKRYGKRWTKFELIDLIVKYK